MSKRKPLPTTTLVETLQDQLKALNTNLEDLCLREDVEVEIKVNEYNTVAGGMKTYKKIVITACLVTELM